MEARVADTMQVRVVMVVAVMEVRRTDRTKSLERNLVNRQQVRQRGIICCIHLR